MDQLPFGIRNRFESIGSRFPRLEVDYFKTKNSIKDRMQCPGAVTPGVLGIGLPLKLVLLLSCMLM